MAFRDDVVLTLALVAAVATGSTAGEAAGTAYTGSYAPQARSDLRWWVEPSATIEVAEVTAADRAALDPPIPRLEVRDSRVVVDAPEALYGMGAAVVRVRTPRRTHLLQATVPTRYLARARGALAELVPSPALPPTFALRPDATCPGILAQGHRRAWGATFSVPLRCLGDPAWVQAVTPGGRVGPRVTVR